MSRREVLRAGGLGLLGLGLPDLLRARAASPSSTGGRAKACILLFMWGGPAQQDTWDPKPEAPAEYRGEFRPIATAVPGLRVCLDVDNRSGELRPGLFVTARVRVPVQQTAPFRSLPTGTPTFRPGEPRTVYVCPDHPDQVHEQPGRCPLDQKELEPRPLAANQRLGWCGSKRFHCFFLPENAHLDTHYIYYHMEGMPKCRDQFIASERNSLRHGCSRLHAPQ